MRGRGMGFDWVGATRMGVSHAIRAYQRGEINTSALARRGSLTDGDPARGLDRLREALRPSTRIAR
jgi:hypothetical protein